MPQRSWVPREFRSYYGYAALDYGYAATVFKERLSRAAEEERPMQSERERTRLPDPGSGGARQGTQERSGAGRPRGLLQAGALGSAYDARKIKSCGD